MGISNTNFNWLGGDGDWATTTLWSPTGTPGAADTAIFASGSTELVTGDATIAALTVTGDQLTLDGQILQDSAASGTFITVTANGALTVDANALVSGGAISLDSGSLLTVNGTLADAGGTADAAVVDGLTANWSNGNAVTLNQLYVQNGGIFAGDVALNDGGSVTTDTGSTFGGGTLTLAGGGSVYVADQTGTTNGKFALSEQIVLGSAAGAYVQIGADPDVALSVDGNITGGGAVVISGGTVSLTGTNTFSGDLVVAAGTLVLDGRYAGGTSNRVFLNGATFENEFSTISSLLATPLTVITSSDNNTVMGAAGDMLVFGGAAGTLTYIGTDHSVAGPIPTVVFTQSPTAGATFVPNGALFGPGETISAVTQTFLAPGAGSTVVGSTGVLAATAGGGDLIFGGTSGMDTLSAGGSAATVIGGMGGGQLVQTGAANVEFGAAGGNTTLQGGNSTGNLLFFDAASGATQINLGAGTNSTIVGGGATDTIVSSTGTVNVFEGAGATQFDFTSGNAAADYINGFKVGTDTLHLVGYSDTEAQTALAHANITADGTFITLSDNTVIALFNTSGLTISSFV